MVRRLTHALLGECSFEVLIGGRLLGFGVRAEPTRQPSTYKSFIYTL